MSKDIYTLITGASSGIGKEIANYCAGKHMNLILVSLPGEKLGDVAAQIALDYNVKTRYYETDLTQLDAPDQLFSWTRLNNLQVNILVNNAGIAGASVFESCNYKYIDDRILLNIRALVMLSRLFIPELKNHPKSYILNVASMAAFFPIPYKSLYSASKAFVLFFSTSVRCELKDTGIGVSVVCPNGVRTNATTNKRIDAHGFFGRLTEVTATQVAQKAIEGMFKGKKVIIPGRINYLLLTLQRLVPSAIQHNLLRNEFKKEVQATCSEDQNITAGASHIRAVAPDK